MPMFYFDVREGTGFTPDEIGQHLKDLDAAERMAAESAAAIGRELFPSGYARDVNVEVRDQQGQRVLTATVSLHIDRAQPPMSQSLGASPS